MTTLPNPQAERPVLAVNAGSSSLKFGLYPSDPAQGQALFSGEASGLEPGGQPRWRLAGGAAQPLPVADGVAPFDAALQALLPQIESHAPQGLLAVAHRIVHGGPRCTAACRLDADTLAYLASLNSLAPLHQPHNLDGVAVLQRHLPGVPQVGCFDTAFHATLPAVEQALPLPATLTEPFGLRRYGFHGLSYDYLAQVLGQRSPRFSQGKALLAHLGNGASVCGTRAGRSAVTSMGFSALDGLMMGTRSGSLDPGVLLHLLDQGHNARSLEALLYRQSGLKGVSGLSADMRTLRASDAPAAQAAIALFTHRLVREAGAAIAVLGGLDVLAFTGGIGEHDVALRRALGQALAYLGVVIDDAANRAADGRAVAALHTPASTAEVWVVPTDEGRVAAAQARALLAAEGR